MRVKTGARDWMGARRGKSIIGPRRNCHAPRKPFCIVTAAIFAICLATEAPAQTGRGGSGQEPLADSIRRLARERGIEILFSPSLIRGRVGRSTSFRGPPEAVLERLLENSGIAYRRTPEGTYYLVRLSEQRREVAPTKARSASEPSTTLADNDEVAVIVVTGRKREELLAETPLAITAIGARQIRDSGARKLEELMAFAPGVYVPQQGFLRPGRVDTNVRFRGMSVNTGTPQEQLASVFVDGVRLSDGIQSLSLEDAERVEVISGPQSAIFGRSTFAGAINIITRPPAEQLTVKSDAILTTHGDLDLSGSIEGAIVPDLLAGRISGRLLRNRGDYRNPATPGKRLGRQVTGSLAANLRLTLRDFSASARFGYSRDDDGPPVGWALGVAEANCGPFGGGNRPTICGNLPGIENARFGQNVGDGKAVADLLRREAAKLGPVLRPPNEYGMERTIWNGSFNIAWAVPSVNLRLEANGGVSRRRRSILSDSDLGPDRVTIAFFPMRSRDTSFEVRARSQWDRAFNWSLGASYFDQRHHETVEGIYSALVLPTSYDPVCTSVPVDCDPATLRPDAADLYLGTNPYFIGHVTTKSLFGSAGLRLSPFFDASVELRREWDRVQDKTLRGRTLEQSFATWLYRAVLSAHPSENSMVYVSASNGNLPGRFNASVIGASQGARERLAELGARDTLPQQKLQNLEMGFKLRTDELSLSLSAYRMRWNRQRIRQTFFDTDTNRTITYLNALGSSNLRGLELQANWRPATWLELGLIADVAAARFKKQSSLVALRVLGDADVSGNRIPGSPRYSGALTGTVSGKLDGQRSWYVRTDAIYRGRLYVDELNLATLPATVSVNARVGIKDDRFRIELFASNLLQSRVPRFAASQADISVFVPAFDFTYPGVITEAPPTRKFGLRVSGVF